MTATTMRTKTAAIATAALLCGGAAVTATPLDAHAATDTTTRTTSRDATLATALSGTIPCSIGARYDIGCGRMKNGRLRVNRNAPRGSHINIKGIDEGELRKNVQFVDVAGDSRKEAVVIISVSAGGVGWPNAVTVYDGNGKLLTTWNAVNAIQKGRKITASGARESTTFTRARATSIDLRTDQIALGSQCEACGTGVDVYRLSKGKNGKPVFRLITRR